jgi:hypothetical protein
MELKIPQVVKQPGSWLRENSPWLACTTVIAAFAVGTVVEGNKLSNEHETTSTAIYAKYDQTHLIEASGLSTNLNEPFTQDIGTDPHESTTSKPQNAIARLVIYKQLMETEGYSPYLSR